MTIKNKSIAITISDGWAYRYLFATGAFEYLTKEYEITLICSEYYINLLQKNKINSIRIIPIQSVGLIDSILISILNVFYRNSFDNAINNFYLSKYNLFTKFIYYFFVKWHMSFSFFFFEKVISFFVKYRGKYFYNNNQYSAFESILFLSPYSCNEII